MTDEKNELRIKSIDFAIKVSDVCDNIKGCSIYKNQIIRSSSSIGANIHEAQYAHGKADFVSKLQIALKEANETSYWLLLLVKTNIIVLAEYDRLENLCREIRITLIASINTARNKNNEK